MNAFSFLAEILGSDGAKALQKAADREPSLRLVLVPRAALAWVAQQSGYEGRIPGQKNSYLLLKKSVDTYSGTVSFPDGNYQFTDKSPEHVAAAISASLGIELSKKHQVDGLILERLGKSIDILAKAKDDIHTLTKRILDPSLGYKITHEHHPDINLTTVRAHAPDGSVAGEAAFTHTPENTLVPETVQVHPAHQRKGLASALYAHAQQQTGKKVVPSTSQTPAGQALWNGTNGAFKTELPGMTAKPQAQEGAVAPTPPTKQPKKAAKPQLPALKVEKTEAARVCSACGRPNFTNNKFTGCICWRSLAKSISTTVFSDGYVLQLDPSLGINTFQTLRKALK
jgi:predicted GNAT family acetyltransferase/ribosomal protein S14